MINDMNQLINQINENFISTNVNIIERIKLGFINNDDYCVPFLYSIIVHALDNIDIFNETQLQNIESYINKLNYG